MKKPITLMIKPASSLCNLQCDYCFYLDEEKNRANKYRTIMNSETIENIVIKAHQTSNNINYIFQGGEPSLATLPWFENFIELVDKYKNKNDILSFSFQTNGTLIDDKFAKFLKKHNFLVGVSFDGFSRIHDIHRKFSDSTKSSRSVKKGLKHLEENKVDYNILTVVTNEVAINITKIYKNLVDERFTYHQYIACLDPIESDENKFLNPTIYGKFLVELFDLWINDLKQSRNISIRLFNNFVSILLGNPPEACDMNGVCSQQYVFESNGDTFPCDFYCLDDYLLGNINKDSFDDIDNRREQIGFIKNPPNLHEDCNSCPYLFLCRGGCPRYKNSENKFRFCESYKYFFDKRLVELESLAAMISTELDRDKS